MENAHEATRTYCVTRKYPDVKAKLAAMAYVPIGSTPQECAEFFQSEMAKWGPVIKQAGLKAE